jgi:hypothetical protein
MTTEGFRQLALGLPGAAESSHMGHPDFRVNGKIFATLHYPDENWGMVKLPPEQQHLFVQQRPEVFVPAKGVWGRQGSTNVRLDAVDNGMLEHALRLAWSNLAAARGQAARRGKQRPATKRQ